MRKIKILGVKINDSSLSEVKAEIERFLFSDRPHLITTVNPEIVLKAKRDSAYQAILNQASLSLADGVGLIYASAFLRQKIRHRITGNDLVDLICRLAEEKKHSVYLLGGRGEVPRKAADKLRKKFPLLKIAGTSNGSLNGRELLDRELVEKIRATQPAVLLVAFGAPKQEKWLFNNLPNLPFVRIGVGVGGAFDFLAGRVKRAPLFLQKIGLEWLWRLFCQPWRIFRIFNAVFRFSWIIIKNKKNEE